MSIGLHYNINLSESVSNILSSDFWILEHIGKEMLPITSDPIKFSSSAIVLIRKGSCKIEINLMSHNVTAPCLIKIRRAQILQIREVSDDFDAACLVMSKRFTESVYMLLKDSRPYMLSMQQQATPVPEGLMQEFDAHIKQLAEIYADTSNPFSYQAEVYAIASFFYKVGHKCFANLEEKVPKINNRIPDRFLKLVQQHYKKERFLEFYAEQLEITPKHLSRTMKSLTGFTAVEWIERYVVLEAKVLLKSTNLNIQQIADELNFPSQSFFGKYFKKNIGMSPKEFRNS